MATNHCTFIRGQWICTKYVRQKKKNFYFREYNNYQDKEIGIEKEEGRLEETGMCVASIKCCVGGKVAMEVLTFQT